MGVIKLAAQTVLIVGVVGGGVLAWEHRETLAKGFTTDDDSIETSAPSIDQKSRENATRHMEPTSISIKIPTTTSKPVGPVLPTPAGPTTSEAPSLRGITVLVKGKTCTFIDDATGEPVHELMEGEVVRLSTNQNGAGLVGIDGGNFSNEYTLAVELSTSKEPIHLKFGTSIAAQCQDAKDFALLTEPPHQFITDDGKAMIPVTKPYSKELFNGETFNPEKFVNTDFGQELFIAGIELPGN